MKRTRTVLVILVLVAAVMAMVLNVVNSAGAPRFRVGLSLSPKSFESSDFSDFFQKAKQGGSVVSWAGDWLELGNPNSGPDVVTQLASSYGYTPIIEAQFFSQSTGQLLRPLDESAKKTYLDSAVAFASKYKPEFLALGIEVNVLFEKSPADFDVFTVFYGQVYDAIKAASPNTKVFTIFQLERMKGLNGGLLGSINDPSKAQWALLEKFPKNDIVAFTSYPSLVFKDPSELPADYYSEISVHSSGAIAITETGWHTAPSPTGWEGSESKQAAFVTRLFSLLSGVIAQVVIWSFLYDQNVIEPFDSMGLWHRDGTPKQAWQTWLNTATESSTTTTTISQEPSTSRQGSQKCLIATAAFGTELAPPVQFLREFRDRDVNSTYLGNQFLSAFNAWYYSWSPNVAKMEEENGIVRTVVRVIILPLVGSLFLAHGIYASFAKVNSELALLMAGFAASAILGICYLGPFFYLGRRLSGKQAGRKAMLATAVCGMALALWGTLGYGSLDLVQNFAAIFVVEGVLLAPLALTSMKIGFHQGEK